MDRNDIGPVWAAINRRIMNLKIILFDFSLTIPNYPIINNQFTVILLFASILCIKDRNLEKNKAIYYKVDDNKLRHRLDRYLSIRRVSTAYTKQNTRLARGGAFRRDRITHTVITHRPLNFHKTPYLIFDVSMLIAHIPNAGNS